MMWREMFGLILGLLILTCSFHEYSSPASVIERDPRFYNLVGRYPHNQTWIFDGERYYYTVLKMVK